MRGVPFAPCTGSRGQQELTRENPSKRKHVFVQHPHGSASLTEVNETHAQPQLANGQRDHQRAGGRSRGVMLC